MTAGRTGPPLVSVIVPAYRVEAFVEATLASVVAQTMPDWECVVVDDGGPDRTAEVVAAFIADEPRMRLVRQANTGLSGARNTGLAHADPGSSYVAFLDSDDLWCEDALERLVAACEQHPEAVGAYGYAEFIDEGGTPVQPGFHPGRQRRRHRLVGRRLRPVPELDPVDFDEMIVVAPMWPPAVVMHRRAAVSRAGLFDPQLKQLEDWDFHIRMSRSGVYTATGQQVAWYRQHGGQMTRRRSEFWHMHDLVRRKTWDSPDNTAEQLASLVRVWRHAQGRRVARTGLRLLSAAGHLDRAETARFSRGLALLVRQGLRPGPPVADPEHVELAGRAV